MAELGCFVNVVESDSTFTFIPIKSKAVNILLTTKNDDDNPIDTIIYGLTPIPKYKRRFASDMSPSGINYDNELFDKIAIKLAEILNFGVNKMSVQQAMMMLTRVFSVRHLESLYYRIMDKDDIIYNNIDLQFKSVMVMLKLTKSFELTITAEGGKLLYVDRTYALWELDYRKYKLMPVKAVEYKITLNSVTEDADSERKMAAYVKYHYNRFAVISHGFGHYRLVPYQQVLNHAERTFATYNAIKKTKSDHSFVRLSKTLLNTNWQDFMNAVEYGKSMSECRNELFKSSKTNNPVKKHVNTLQLDEMSTVN
uniref:Non-structural protein 2 n=2 Tax=Rotavirus D TaxID=335100 RepID=A0A346BLG6_9REOV|nr:NSP2 [Rotavirus D]